MSGGHFNYMQHNIEDIIGVIGRVIIHNEQPKLDEWITVEHPIYSDETIAKFREAITALKIAYVYAQRIDWLLSGDDGEEQFHQRLKKELNDHQDKQ